jgi:hypothetical protein
MAQIDDLFQRRPQQILLTIVSWFRHRVPPALMTHYPIAQIAQNGNPISQENRLLLRRFLQDRLLNPPPFASHLNGPAILHGRRSRPMGTL